MKILLTGALLSLTFSLNAQAPQPVPLARGNTPGEPHHHLKIENEYVRAYYVEVPPHEDTQLHQHDNDYLFLTLGNTEVINAVLGKPEVKLSLKDGEVRFTRGGFAHVARNPGDKPFRNVTIELLKPQGEPRNMCEKVIEGPLNDCQSSGSSNVPADSPLRALARAIAIKPLFQTDEVLGTSFSISLKQNYTDTDSQNPHLLVVEDGSDLRVEFAAGTSNTLKGGAVLWLEPERKWTIVTPGGQKPARFLLIEFRGGSSDKKS